MSDNALRNELAGHLGTIFHGRQDIVSLVEAHVAGLAVADLPQETTARLLWLYVLNKLIKRGDRKALAELLDEGRARSKRIEWSSYEGLANDHPSEASVGAPWSDLDVELRWQDERTDRPELTRVASKQVVLRAVVAQQWEGPRPNEPTVTADVSWLWLAKRRVNATVRATESEIEDVATWTATFAVKPPRFATRKIAVTVDNGTDRSTAARYLVSPLGHHATLVLWLALAGFVGVWLLPFGMNAGVAGLAFWVVTFGFGWLLPRIRHRAGAWSWITRAWETTGPLVAALAIATMVLPRLLFTIAVNHTSREVLVSDGTKLQQGEQRTFLLVDFKFQVLESTDKDPLICVCPGEGDCGPCQEPAVRGVVPKEILCTASAKATPDTCLDKRPKTLAELAARPVVAGSVSGDATVALSYPKDFHSLWFSQDAFSLAEIRSGGKGVTITNARFTSAAPDPIELVVLRGPRLEITWPERGVLECAFRSAEDGASMMVTRVIVTPAAKLELAAEGVTSTWRPRTSSTEQRACVRHGARLTLGIDKPTRGQRVALTTAAGIQQIAIRVRGKSIELRCDNSTRLRFISLVGDLPSSPLEDLVFERLDDRLGVTCSSPGTRTGDRRRCVLGDDQLECTRISAPAEPCTDQFDTRTKSHFVYHIATPRCPRLTDAEAEPLRRLDPKCTSFDRCSSPAGEAEFSTYVGPCRRDGDFPPWLDRPKCTFETADKAALDAFNKMHPNLTCTSIFRCKSAIPDPKPPVVAHPCTILMNGLVYPIETPICPRLKPADPAVIRARKRFPTLTCTTFDRCLGPDPARPRYAGPCTLEQDNKTVKPLDREGCKPYPSDDATARRAVLQARPTMTCSAVYRCN